ncbi:MAG: PilZ domain-containing protein [Oscillospiraceae bacterium]|nr:PilZ domain-containing protein [Oscillospiraceae bacterium]
MSKVLVKRSDRRVVEPQVSAVIKDKIECRDAQILDLSRKGLRFRSKEQYKKGDKLKFEMQSANDDPALSLSIGARVINVYGSETDGMFEYGVRFFRLLYWYEMNCIHNYVYSTIKN